HAGLYKNLHRNGQAEKGLPQIGHRLRIAQQEKPAALSPNCLELQTQIIRRLSWSLPESTSTC
ncbi:MAG: hypothetical protein AAFQ61_09515, partial [Cyanobacteria bacterium J06626_23]